MIPCPACGADEVRLHGLIEELAFKPRWGFFGRPVLRRRIRAAEVSCARCFRTFVIRPEGITESPVQTINEMLNKAASNGTKGPSNERADNPPRAKAPRAAPDPRQRR